jgi:signal transduction histidine kinase/DNA-binding NarL/FixJ family response regulator/CHASE3 domain sensor protein
MGVPVLLIFLVLVFFTYRFAENEREEQGWILHTYQVMDQVQKVSTDAHAAESAQRGFLLTRQNSFLEPYRRNVDAALADLEVFKARTNDNPSQQLRAATLQNLLQQRFAALKRTLVVGTGSIVLAKPLSEALLAGNTSMVELRRGLNAALAEETGLLRARILKRHAAERLEILAASVVASFAIAIVILAIVLLVLGNRRLVRSEADRRRHAILLQTTLDNIRDGVAVFDGQGKLVAFNSNFFGCMGFPSVLAAVGTSIDKFDILARERKQPAFGELPFVTGGYGAGYRDITFDNRHIEIYRNHVPEGGFLVACLDVTERVVSELAFRQAQKMETIGQLTGGVAHDFNNLLQIIGANLDLMGRDLEPGSRTSDRLQNALSAVDRGARLTGQLLAFARRQALTPRVIGLGRLLQDMTDMLRRTLGERIELEAVIGGGLWNTMIDQGQLENALLNLAINARDAMPNGGKLTIELANAYLDEVYARENAEVIPGQYVMIAVSDTGEGMPPEAMARAFEPFFTTKPEGQGTGLGLSQVYGFVKQSGGHVKIYSERGLGTTVKLYLPRSKAAPQLTSPTRVEPAEGGHETVLVVEDDDGVRAAVTDMLNDLGYAVLRAENAEQALELLKEGHHADMLFTDVVIPGPINTREFARLAKEILPSLKVLFTSGYTQNAIVHNGRLDEGVELLSKPYRKDDLARKLRSILDAGNYKSGPNLSAVSAVARAEPVIYRNRLKVLVVEDSALIRMTTMDMVADLELDCIEAANGTDAVTVLKNDSRIDVLLTDLGLPGMSGAQLVQEARKLRPGIRVVVASGYSEEYAPGDVLTDVFRLQKPFTLDQLRVALKPD